MFKNLRIGSSCNSINKRNFSSCLVLKNEVSNSNSLINAGILLSRNPIVTADMNDFEKKYYKYQEELSRRLMWTFPQFFYFRKGTLAERRFLDAQRGPVSKQPGVWFPKGVPDIMHNRERRYKQEIIIPREETSSTSGQEDSNSISRPIQPNSRITKSDELNDFKSLERKLSRTLYLVINTNENNIWKFPSFQLEKDLKPLHIVAEEGLRKLGGDLIKTWTVSNTPTAVLKYSKDKKLIIDTNSNDANNDDETNISREYLIKSHILAGKFQLQPSQNIKEFRWLTKEEIEKLVTPNYFQQIGHLLSNV
ncbi:hypothetical protein PACTADRAFT_49929 [Pachysolen tannophilus NRRL Y-2460]|uniref:Large ribosomal subunit protein mL46 n=1 Tax=Pachysolen tannophilus NRRL Y-2460 TaxID=669874 RepID=A0A1E4TTW7_PACTA|nr:hypothetical protein PACTADRAFT_49929 [Pachysolen tannophilus NRRL Y-2460]